MKKPSTDRDPGGERERPVEQYSIEELDEVTEERKNEQDAEGLVDTAHTDGSTSNPHLAQEQGLVYDPPSDPPVLPSDDPQGAEVAAGFAPSMEDANPDVEDLPPRVDNQDLDLQEGIKIMVRNNSETTHLNHIQVSVTSGVVLLRGTVPTIEDIAIVQYLVRDMEGVDSVVNDLRVSDNAA